MVQYTFKVSFCGLGYSLMAFNYPVIALTRGSCSVLTVIIERGFDCEDGRKKKTVPRRRN
jgi:hypothetical protein